MFIDFYFYIFGGTIMERSIKGIYKENDSWRVRKKYKGVCISFIRKTRQEAISDLKYRIKEIDDKIKLDICLDRKVQKKTLKDVFIEYTNEKGTRWKNNTKNYNVKLFNNHFSPIADIKMCDLTDAAISNWIDGIKSVNDNRDGRSLSNLPYRVTSLLKGLLGLAMRKRYCSPSLDLSFVNNIKKIKTVTQKTEDNYINYTDFTLLCSAISSLPENPQAQKNDDMLFLIKFLYYTGLRIGEARAIKKSDIIREVVKTSTGSKYMYYINVYKKFGDNDFILDNTLKCNNPKRKVKIVNSVFIEFMSYLNSHGFKDEDYIFDFKKNNRPLYRSVISNNLVRIIKKSKELNLLPETFVDVLTAQGFRYSNTIYLKNILKVPIEIAAENQGHTVAVMLNIYTRIDKNDDIDIFATEILK